MHIIKFDVFHKHHDYIKKSTLVTRLHKKIFLLIIRLFLINNSHTNTNQQQAQGAQHGIFYINSTDYTSMNL